MITHTTARLRLRIRDKLHLFFDQRDPLLLIACLIAVPLIAITIAASIVRSWPAPQLPPMQPIVVIATAPAVVVPTAVPPAAQVAAVLPANALRRAVVAYGAPDSTTALGAIEQGRTYAVLARYGAEWLQADVQGSGVVWLKADQVLDLPAGLLDLQPTDAPVIVERPVYVAAPMPAVATPEPEAAASAPPPTMQPQQAAIYDRQQWAIDAQRATR